jgi:hypothetical protein
LNDVAQKFPLAIQLHNFARTKAADNTQNQPKTFQGHVSAILANDMLEFTLDASGPYTLPKLQIPQAFSSYHREPTQVGDKGYAVPSDFSIGGIDGVATGLANMFGKGNLATHVFHPISNKNFDQRDPNMFLVTGGPSGHTIQSKDKSTSTVIDILNNILHHSSTSIQHTALRNIIHTAGDILSHNGVTINQIASGNLNSVATGVINHVASSIVMGAPSAAFVQQYADSNSRDIQLPPIPPIPSLPTLLNVIGHISASLTISAAGGMTSGGQPVMTEPVPPQLIQAPLIVDGTKDPSFTALANLLQTLQQLGLILDNTT